MYRLQFHRFISECFASNFVLFSNERDTCKRRCLYINFDNAVNICGNYFFRGNFFGGSWKNRENPKNLNPENRSACDDRSARAMFLAFLTVWYVTSHARLAQVTQWHDLF